MRFKKKNKTVVCKCCKGKVNIVMAWMSIRTVTVSGFAILMNVITNIM